MDNYIFPLSIQFNSADTAVLLSAYTGKNKKGEKILKLLQKRNFYGVELNILDYSINPGNLAEYLGSFNLKLINIATGAYAVKNGLSLSSPDKNIRDKTLAELITIIKFAHDTGKETGVICGFIKGKNNEKTTQYFTDSLSRLDPIIRKLKTPLLIEVTNHYESSVANTISETMQLVKNLNNPHIYVLPDTYHMNIEENNFTSDLIKNIELFNSIHVSDNNRRYPGYGMIDFYNILMSLKISGYNKGIAIEGNTVGKIEENINYSADYLSNVSEKIKTVLEK